MIAEEWKKWMKNQGFKFLVLKIEDFLDSLKEEKDIIMFNNFLRKYNEFREPKPINEYYVVNKDDVPHIKTTEEFFKIIGYEPEDSSN